MSCSADGPQVAWLESDLAAHPSDCLLGYWHYPRWSSGRHGSQDLMDPFWQVMREHGADVVLSGHDHDYERIWRTASASSWWAPAASRTTRSRTIRSPRPRSRNDSTYGLLWLALGDGTYQWQFLGLGDTGFTDSGDGSC